jgi:hypothetical protein
VQAIRFNLTLFEAGGPRAQRAIPLHTLGVVYPHNSALSFTAIESMIHVKNLPDIDRSQQMLSREFYYAYSHVRAAVFIFVMSSSIHEL